jgi:hypothetical protein
MVDSRPLTQEEIIKIYKEAFGKGDQLVTLEKILIFAKLIEKKIKDVYKIR